MVNSIYVIIEIYCHDKWIHVVTAIRFLGHAQHKMYCTDSDSNIADVYEKLQWFLSKVFKASNHALQEMFQNPWEIDKVWFAIKW